MYIGEYMRNTLLVEQESKISIWNEWFSPNGIGFSNALELSVLPGYLCKWISDLADLEN